MIDLTIVYRLVNEDFRNVFLMVVNCESKMRTKQNKIPDRVFFR